MRPFAKLSPTVLRYTYFILTTLEFISGLATYNWLIYESYPSLGIPALVVLALSATLVYLLKKESEVRAIPLLWAFSPLQQYIAISILMVLTQIVMLYKVFTNTSDDSLNMVYWLLFGLAVFVFLGVSLSIYKELKRRKDEKNK